MNLNTKDIRILKLWEKGMDKSVIARKIGYSGTATEKGIERVNDALKRTGKSQ